MSTPEEVEGESQNCAHTAAPILAVEEFCRDLRGMLGPTLSLARTSGAPRFSCVPPSWSGQSGECDKISVCFASFLRQDSLFRPGPLLASLQPVCCSAASVARWFLTCLSLAAAAAAAAAAPPAIGCGGRADSSSWSSGRGIGSPPTLTTPQVAKLKASHVASTRRQSATILVLASVALVVAVAAGVLRGVYGYEHGDVPSFALGLAAAMVPAILVWALPHLVFTPLPSQKRGRGRKGLAPRTPPPKQLLQ